MEFPCLKNGTTYAVLKLEINLPVTKDWLNIYIPKFVGLLQVIYAKVLREYRRSQ